MIYAVWQNPLRDYQSGSPEIREDRVAFLIELGASDSKWEELFSSIIF